MRESTRDLQSRNEKLRALIEEMEKIRRATLEVWWIDGAVERDGTRLTSQMGILLSFVHAEGRCRGERCLFHQPSAHPLQDAPIVMCMDDKSFHRECEHGVLHPDPDDLWWRTQSKKLTVGHLTFCDGCCE